MRLLLSDTFLGIGEPLPFLEMRCRKDILGTTLTGLCLIFCHASCNLQETFFSIKISEFFLTSQTSLKKSLVYLESFWKELKLQKVCVCCKTSAAGNKMFCHCNFPSDVGLLLSKRSFWCTLELTSETLLSAPRKLTHFCLENSTSQTLKVLKN